MKNQIFDYKKFSVNTITGLQKIGTTLSNGRIYAIDIKYKFSEKFDVGTSYVGRHENIDFTNENKPTNINQLSKIIKQASFVVSNDTGPAHIAAHLNVKGLALFGSHTSAKKVSIETNNFKVLEKENLDKLTPLEVLDTIAKQFST